MIAASILAYILIAVSFAPSVYGQAFPAERARFLGRLLMTAALMFEGGGLGIFLRNGNCVGRPSQQPLAMILFAVSTLYAVARHGISCRIRDRIISFGHRCGIIRQAQIIANKAKGVRQYCRFRSHVQHRWS